jgi:phytoene synthase
MSASIDPQAGARIGASIAVHSKSFALAAKLLPPELRGDVRVLYAYCRRADDALDLCPRGEQGRALSALCAELDEIYGANPPRDETARAFAEVVRAREIPRAYPEALLAGMEMDASGFSYASWDELLRYCYRVAGTVGLMMCHVMGVRRERALVHAAHLGIAMQLTNIARDVREDFERGRLYLPAELLGACGVAAPLEAPGGALPDALAEPFARATRVVLSRADDYYRSADAGMNELSPRCALAVRSARAIYAAIGGEVRRNACDPRAPRAVVSASDKLRLALCAGVRTLIAMPEAFGAGLPRRPRVCLDESVAATGVLP